MDFSIVGAREVALVMLTRRFGPHAGRAPDATLACFQQDAVERLARIIERRGGAFLCDSVGLGKTHVAMALARRARDIGGPVLITGPSQLAAQWRRHTRGIDGSLWLSHAALSRGAGSGMTLTGGLIIVDEAHAMRNPATRRYRNLALMCAGASVLLVTATPVNNSVRDFYHLIRLFAGDDHFADIGVPDLRSAAADASSGGDASSLRRVAEDVMVRRTRAVVLRTYGTEPLGGDCPRLAFPTQLPVRHVHYELKAVYPDLERTIRKTLPRLRFPAHVLGRRVGEGVSELMRMSLLKRLESSSAAFAASIRRHRRLVGAFLRAAEDGLLLDARMRASGHGDDAGSEQLALDAVLHRPWPAALDRERFMDLAVEEAGMLDGLSASIRGEATDPKVEALIDALERDFVGERVVIFTEFRDTARMLWEVMSPLGGAGIVHGSDARIASGPVPRRGVIERFAPVANHARLPAPHEKVTRLVATDVLAEGLNLQDARVVISFDLPWNPVRLAQRVGRIDRLGSPHQHIEVIVFMPDRGLELVLQLLRRIRRKLRDIRMVGGDRPRLDVGRRAATGLAAGCGTPDQDLERTELLRARYTEVSDAHGPVTATAPVAAAMPWNGAAPAVLCCVAIDDATWFVLVQAGRPPVVHAVEIDAVLLAAVNGDRGLKPDAVRIRSAGRRAIAAVQRVAASAWLTRKPRAVRRAARTVHRWLAGRPGGPNQEEVARADALLRALATGSSAGFDGLVEGAIRQGRPDDEAVQELEKVLSGRVPGPGDPDRKLRHRRSRRPRVCAALELVPSRGGPPQG